MFSQFKKIILVFLSLSLVISSSLLAPASALAHLPKKKDGSPNTMPLGFAAKNCSRFSAAELRTLFAAAAAFATAVT